MDLRLGRCNINCVFQNYQIKTVGEMRKTVCRGRKNGKATLESDTKRTGDGQSRFALRGGNIVWAGPDFLIGNRLFGVQGVQAQSNPCANSPLGYDIKAIVLAIKELDLSVDVF